MSNAADIDADGAVTFGATRTGGLSTAADISTSNDNITFHRAVTLTGPVQLNTDTGGGNVEFFATTGTVNGTQNLTIAAGTGNVEFDAIFGGTTPLADLAVTSADEINFDAAITAANVTANGTTIDGSGLVTAGAIDLDAVNGIGATTPLQLAATTLDATNTTLGVIHINELDAVAVGITHNGTRNVTLNAGGAITDNNAAATNVTGGIFTVDAGGSVDLDTDVASLDASTSATGDIDINEANAITLTAVDTNDGSITVVAGGMITATNVDSSNTDDDANDISLTTTSGDVLVGLVDAGTIGDVSVVAAGAINEAATADANADIVAHELTLTAFNGIGNISPLEVTAADITVNTTSGNISIDSLAVTAVNVSSLTTGGVGGTIDFGQSGNQSLTLTTVSTTDGNVTITNTGGTDANIQIGEITADATDDIVSLTAAGAINDAATDTLSDLTAFQLGLNAAAGIGNNEQLETAVSQLAFDNTMSGDV